MLKIMSVYFDVIVRVLCCIFILVTIKKRVPNDIYVWMFKKKLFMLTERIVI